MSDTKRNRDGKNGKANKKGSHDAKKAEREEDRKTKHIPRRPHEPGKITRQLERAAHIVNGANAGSFKKPEEKAKLDRGRIGCRLGVLVDEKASKFIQQNAVFCLGGPEGTRPEFQIRSSVMDIDVVVIIDDPRYITEKVDGESDVPETVVADLAGNVASWLFSREDYDNPKTKEARFYIAPPDRHDFFATQVLTAIASAEWVGNGNEEGKNFVAKSDDEVLVTRRVRKDEMVTVAGTQYVARYIEGGGLRLLTLEEDAARKATLAKALPQETAEGLEKLKATLPASRPPQQVAPRKVEKAEREEEREVTNTPATAPTNTERPQPVAQPRPATVTALNADIKRLGKRELLSAIGKLTEDLEKVERQQAALEQQRKQIAASLAAHEAVYDDLIARQVMARQSVPTESVEDAG